MNFIFHNHIPLDYKGQPILISGDDSRLFSNADYLVSDSDVVYEIRYEYKTSPFNDIKIFGERLAVGFHEFFYLYDVESKILLLKLKCSFILDIFILRVIIYT